MKFLIAATALALIALPAAAQNRTDPNATPLNITMSVDAGRKTGTLKPVWRYFGADEPNYATMKDGRKLMSHLGDLSPGQVYFRAHNLLNTGDGTPAFKWGSSNAYTEDKDGNPIYDWTITDTIIDSYIERGVHPYLQIGFMPEAMSSGPKEQQYQHTWRPGFSYGLIAGRWNAPPKDYAKWEELNYQWTKHNIARYGPDEVAKWYFEVWNEADGAPYWTGTPDEFNKLHDFAIAGVLRAYPQARVGGPDLASYNSTHMDSFLNHIVSGKNYVTGATGTQTDFLAFHAKGSPKFVDGYVRMGLKNHLTTVDRSFAKIASFPQLKSKPIVIGESDPEGCAACPGAQMAYRNGTLYSSYTAASFPRIWKLAEKNGVNLEGVLTWAFEFENQPWFAGYRQLSSNGIDLPVMNVFRLFEKLGSDELASTSTGEKSLDDITANGVPDSPDVGIVATRTTDKKLALLVWHYHDNDVAAAPAAVTVNLTGLGKMTKLAVTQWRIDRDNGNAFTEWQTMGSPQSPNENQYRDLEAASAMKPLKWAAPVTVKKGNAQLTFTVPRQGVTLLVLE